MTTVGVKAFQPERVDALWFNSYNYHYPAFKQKQLCDYFDCYRSKIPPRFRRTDVERMRQYSQSFMRTIATDLGTNAKPDFLLWAELNGQSQVSPEIRNEITFRSPAIPAKSNPDLLVRPRINSKEYSRWRFETTPVVTTQARAEWNTFLSRCPERFDIQLPLSVPGNGSQPYFDGGYGLRYLRPYLTRGLGMERNSQRFLGEIQGPATDSPFRSITVTSPFVSYG